MPYLTNDDGTLRWENDPEQPQFMTDFMDTLFQMNDNAKGEDVDDEYDENGYDAEGYDENGHDEFGYDRDGYDSDGYNSDGFNQWGYDRDGYDEDGYDEDGYNEEGLDRDGLDRYGENPNADWLSDYEPDYIFKSTGEELEVSGETSRRRPIKGKLYFGMEIELSSDCNYEVQSIIQDKYDAHVWAKEDCSVAGFEMVTHPMTFDYAMESFPWQIVDELGRAGCHVQRESNGLHIHVSRDGFNGFAHQYRWCKMFYNMSEQILGTDDRGLTGIGGRKAWEWGTFQNRANQFEVLKSQLAQSHGKYGSGYRYTCYLPRYLALNLQNDHTIEVRVFASTIREEELRKRFELVAATVEYTRNLTVQDIRNGAWEYEAFRSWLVKNEGSYPALERALIPVMALA